MGYVINWISSLHSRWVMLLDGIANDVSEYSLSVHWCFLTSPNIVNCLLSSGRLILNEYIFLAYEVRECRKPIRYYCSFLFSHWILLLISEMYQKSTFSAPCRGRLSCLVSTLNTSLSNAEFISIHLSFITKFITISHASNILLKKTISVPAGELHSSRLSTKRIRTRAGMILGRTCNIHLL